jgi:arabinogalactan oligomer / maltooligosaccharide transport system substrate-binding protein
VAGLLVARHAPNRIIVEDFLPDYLTRPDLLDALSGILGSPLASLTSPTADPGLEVFLKECQPEMIMPSFPEMAVVWDLVGRAEAAVIGGEDPGAALAWACDRIDQEFREGEGISTPLTGG